MRSYCLSLTGKDHIKQDLPCQDFSKQVRLDNGWLVLAVADGVGSAPKAEYGSRISVTRAVDFCADNFPASESGKSIESLILLAFEHAFKAVVDYSSETGSPVEDFDTTLAIVCFKEGRVVYGHCGDGGIFVQDRFGEIREITQPQKGDDGDSMIPLRFGAEYNSVPWVVAEYADYDIPIVLLATDGVRDKLSSNELVRSRCKVYAPLFALLTSIYACDSYDPEEFTSNISKILADGVSSSQVIENWTYDSIRAEYARLGIDSYGEIVDLIKKNNEMARYVSSITDDITVAVVVDDELDIILDDDIDHSYFADPDWKEIRIQAHRTLYPHLY